MEKETVADVHKKEDEVLEEETDKRWVILICSIKLALNQHKDSYIVLWLKLP